jgi:hypothetical protein
MHYTEITGDLGLKLAHLVYNIPEDVEGIRYYINKYLIYYCTAAEFLSIFFLSENTVSCETVEMLKEAAK